MLYYLQPSEALDLYLNEQIYLIDVREQDEYQEQHIPLAQLHPLSHFNPKEFCDSTLPIVIHCRSGKRSLSACHMILQEYPELDVYQLEGGILGWAALENAPIQYNHS